MTTTSVQPDTATPTSNSDPTPTPTVSITPTVLTTLLSNPGIGLETTYGTSATSPNNGTLSLGAAYTRYCWSQFEPSKGNFNFTQMVNDYNAARAQGQDYCFRIMPYDNTTGGPAWLQALGVSGYTYTAFGGPTLWAPNMADPTVMTLFQNLVQAFGARFDGLPGFGPIDIGSIGLWGEWHNYDTNIISINGNAPAPTGQGTGNQIPIPALSISEAYINWFFTYFPNTIKIMGLGQIPSEGADSTLAYEAGQYALGLGVGTRMDSWQDPGAQGDFLDCLPNGINNTNWQKYPVYFEVAGHLSSLSLAEVQETLNWAISVHASVVEDQGEKISAQDLPYVEAALMQIGYRYELTNLSYSATATPGDPLALTMTWQNVGDAPSYSNDVVAVQIRNSSGTVVSTTNTGIAVKNWLPGTYTVTPSVTLPADLAAGTYTIAIGIVNPTTMLPDIQLAIQGRDANGWYPLGTVSVNQ